MTDDRDNRSEGDEPVAQPARRTLFEQLVVEKRITADVYRAARDQIESRSHMRDWLLYSLLVFGFTLILTGVTLFFVYNWPDLPHLAKLGIVKGGIAACLGAALYLGEDSTAGRLSVVAAAAAVGIFLAVFGHIYQTGAGFWEWSVGWAVLMAPLVVIARRQTGWLLLGGVVCVAIVTGMFRAGLHGFNWAVMYPAVVAICAAGFWGGLDRWRRRDAEWLEPFWSEYVWCVAICAALVTLELLWWEATIIQIPFSGVFVGSAALWVGRLRGRFNMGLAGCMGVVWLLVSSFHVGRWLYRADLDIAVFGLLMATFVTAVTASLVWGLRRLADWSAAREESP